MIKTDKTHVENMSLSERSLRITVGLVALVGLLHLAVTTAAFYPLATLIASIVTLTGIIGWDPLYAMIQSTQKTREQQTLSHPALHSA